MDPTASDNGASFRAGIVELLPKLWRFARVLSGAPHDADDLVQATVERALNSEASWRPDSRMDSWLYKLMQNLWIDQVRRRKRQGDPAPIEAAFAVPGEDGRTLLEVRAMSEVAVTAFSQLAPEIRAAASLVILNGHSYREAAETLDVPIGTIMSRVARARRALESALGGRFGE